MNARINKSELEAISRALRAKVKAAKAAIIALGPKLKAEFEMQLTVTYPASGDPIWEEALQIVYDAYETQQARVEARCEELRIPERFRPELQSPSWSASWRSSCYDYKDYRAEMRRLAGAQIDDMIKSRLAQLDLDSANIQFEIASEGCVTDAAKDFLKRLPSIESMVPPLKLSEVEAVIEGRPTGGKLSVSDAETKLQLPSPGELLSAPTSSHADGDGVSRPLRNGGKRKGHTKTGGKVSTGITK
jgi:hypothetical protein